MSMAPNPLMPRWFWAGGKLLLPNDCRASVAMTAGAVQVAPPSVDLEKTMFSMLYRVQMT
jgi:hypothetical protein